jgi:transposase
MEAEFAETRHATDVEIQRMWNAGARTDEIATRIGIAQHGVKDRLVRMRKEGYDLQSRQTLAGPRCPRCKQPVPSERRLCDRCEKRQRAKDRRRQSIAAMVRAGKSNREIAARVGMGVEALRTELRQMRKEGYELPRRAPGGRIRRESTAPPEPERVRPGGARVKAIEWRGDQVLELAWRGASDAEIAAELDVGQSTVWNYMDRLRKGGHEFPCVSGRRRSRRDIQRSHEEIATLARSEGLGDDEIAERLGRTTESVRYQLDIMRKAGYDVPPDPADGTGRRHLTGLA